jgi:hypothetical protein
MVQVRDVIEIAPRKVGQATRRGTVKAVQGALLTIAWDSGEETSLVPAAGSMTVLGRGTQPGRKVSSSAKARPRGSSTASGAAVRKGASTKTQGGVKPKPRGVAGAKGKATKRK